jgi:NodT family efflux transporter outer membrane factor (OMF) lipoprotein
MRPLKPLLRANAAALVLTAFTGCAVGPDFIPPKPPKTSGYTRDPLPLHTVSTSGAFGQAQNLHVGAEIPAEWWELFHCDKLSALVTQALRANADIGVARATLRQAAEQTKAQFGGYLPQITGSLSGARNLEADTVLSPSSSSGNPYFTIYTAQLSVSYVPDVFGLNRRTVESLAAQEENALFELRAAYLTLTANVVNAVIQEAGLRAQLDANQQIVDVETKLLGILRRQFTAGQTAEADVLAQEAALAAAQQAMTPLENQLAQQRDLLTALLGRLPADEPAEEFHLSDLVLPEDIPVSLPADLVAQRPDVKAAEASLHAASALVGVAVANRLPNIALTATGGYSNSSPNQLIVPGTAFFSLLGEVTQPLFDGFTLLHRERAARAALVQASEQYRATVITAFQNVSDTLKALEIDARGLQAAAVSERAAARSFAISQKLLDLGAIGFLTLLNAEQTYQQALLTLLQARATRLTDTAALFQALGGGWWNDKFGRDLEFSSTVAPAADPT